MPESKRFLPCGMNVIPFISRAFYIMEPEYFRAHAWLSYHYEKPNKCQNLNCNYKNPKRVEWALRHGKNIERNRDNFIALCPSCHRKYDMTDEIRKKISKSKKGIIPPNRRSVVLNNTVMFNSLTEASKITGISISSIHNNMKGLSMKTKIGKWEYLLQN